MAILALNDRDRTIEAWRARQGSDWVDQMLLGGMLKCAEYGYRMIIELVDTHDIAQYATRRTYQEWVDAWLDLRGRTGAVLRLVAADRNIPVVVWGMTERPVAYGANVRSAVQASWAQAGEYAGGPR